MKTYLITGGCGFIGSNFIHYMLNKYKDIQIVNVDCLTYAGNPENLKTIKNDKRYAFVKANITNARAMEKVFETFQPDYVVHFAAESHVDRSITGPVVFTQSNVLGTAVLLNAARKAWQGKTGKKYLQVSTDEVYGALPNNPNVFFTEKTPLDPHSPYSSSKAGADLLVKAYVDTYNFPANITRCSNNYGPYQYPEKLIPKIFECCCNLQDIPVYGDGLQVRDWLYVEDHCKAIDLVLHKAKAGEIYNIGGHNEKTNMEIVNAVIDYVQQNINPKCSTSLVKHVTDRLGHDRRYAIDPSKITAQLGWKPETKFADGIVKTLQWYKDNKQWLSNLAKKGEKENGNQKC